MSSRTILITRAESHDYLMKLVGIFGTIEIKQLSPVVEMNSAHNQSRVVKATSKISENNIVDFKKNTKKFIGIQDPVVSIDISEEI